MQPSGGAGTTKRGEGEWEKTLSYKRKKGKAGEIKWA